MKHAVILAHPDPDSFNAAVARAYVQAARAQGHVCSVRDLYRRQFNPCLTVDELPWRPGAKTPPDVQAERRAMADVDVFAFVYPLWFNAPPAMLKGWVDRVFGLGFGFKPGRGGNQPNLTGRRLFTVSTSGAPADWVRQTGAFDHLKQGFDDHLAAVCGMEVAGHLHLGGVSPGIRKDAGEDMLADVRRTVGLLFPAQAERTA